MKNLLTMLKAQHDMLLVIGVVCILLILFVPVPPIVLDMLLILNFSVALLVLLVTFYTDNPLSFSTFPSLLLIVTLFRLGLNVSSTRLILNEGDAGEVIASVGEFVVAGNYIVGLVVFFILIVVQYVVVTNGAQRVAEVAARFTLDSMPGKQMSIDADLNMGLVDEKQAKERREEVEKEANFYGAMDGASKFVKGDAIAGIIIIIINIIGGLAIGIAQKGLSWGDALHTYTLLTVGDGLVTQIPSLIISTATGIIITRAATDSHLGIELVRQMVGSYKPLFLVAACIYFCLFLPGLPKVPLFFLGSVFTLLGFLAYKKSGATDKDEGSSNSEEVLSELVEGEKTMSELLEVYPLELMCSSSLYTQLKKDTFWKTRFKTFRQQYAVDMGLILPELTLNNEMQLDSDVYEVRIHGVTVGKGSLILDQSLVMDARAEFEGLEGKQTKEPTYGLPAMWVSDEYAEIARKNHCTVVDAQTVLLTHISELIKSQASELLTRIEVEQLVTRLEPTHASLIDELIPAVISYSELQKVLQLLLKEKVSIRNMAQILEAQAEHCKHSKDINFLTEQTRQKLKVQIVQKLLDNNETLHVITMEAAIEQKLIQGVNPELNSQNLSLDPVIAEQIVKQLTSYCEQMAIKRLTPVVLCYPQVRMAFKQLTERVLPQLHVLSISEVPTSISVKNAGVVMLDKKAA